MLAEHLELVDVAQILMLLGVVGQESHAGRIHPEDAIGHCRRLGYQFVVTCLYGGFKGDDLLVRRGPSCAEPVRECFVSLCVGLQE